MARRVTLTPAEFREQQIREALDGTFVVHHFTGKLIKITVPPDFDPYSKRGEKMIQAAGWQKVIDK